MNENTAKVEEVAPDPTQTVKQLLAALTNLRDKEAVINAAANQKRNTILSPVVRAALMDIDTAEAESLEPVSTMIKELESQVKHWCLLAGCSIKAKDASYQAVWSKARIKWNNAALEGYASINPEILQFRTIGKPSISIRKVKRRPRLTSWKGANWPTLYVLRAA